MKCPWPIGAVALLAACGHPGAPKVAAVSTATMHPSANPLADAAALLAASEQATDQKTRAPLLRRLDGLQVAVAQGAMAEEDTLSQWREQAAATDQRPPFRGRALGPAYRRATIQPGETIRIEQIFYAGERAEIAGQSVGGEPVHLDIRNQRTQQVCTAQLQPAGTCRWLPLFTERFQIDLTNRSKKPASVYIVFR